MIIYTYDFKILKYKFNDIMTIVGGGGDISIVLFMFTNIFDIKFAWKSMLNALKVQFSDFTKYFTWQG
jgi:hypothetical protein